MLKHAFLLLALALTACSSVSERANEQAQRAVALLELGDLNGSRTAALMAVSERDDNSEFWMLLAKIEMARNDFVEAYRAFSRALELDRTNPVALGAVAEIGYQVGELYEADTAADQLLLILPESDSALLIKGLVALDQDRTEDARVYADRLLVANPASATGLSLLARILTNEGQSGAAKQKLQSAMDAGRTEPALLWTLVAILQTEGDIAGTDKALTRLREGAPGQKDFGFKHAFLLYKSGQLDRASATLYELLEYSEKAPDNERRIEQMWLDFGPLVLTPALVDRVRISSLSGAKLLMARHALIYGLTGIAGSLIETVQTGKLKPWQTNQLLGLRAQIAFAKGQISAAMQQSEALLLKDARNSDALLVLAKIQMQEGKGREATASLQNLVSDNPMNRAGRTALAEVYTRTAQPILARQTWEQAVQDMPDDPELTLAYSAYLQRTGEADRQRRLVVDHVAQNPGSPRALFVMKQACAQTNAPWCARQISNASAIGMRYLLEDGEPSRAGNRGLFSSIKPKT
jgi:cellulose synthase operon protein C